MLLQLFRIGYIYHSKASHSFLYYFLKRNCREVMQLFSIGLAMLNDDGTLKLDSDGNEITTYTNFDISEYAKVYVGFRDQQERGNIETKRNEIDPLRIETSWKDHFPKVRLRSKQNV